MMHHILVQGKMDQEAVMFHDSQIIRFLWGSIVLSAGFALYYFSVMYLNWRFPLEKSSVKAEGGLELCFDPVCGELLEGGAGVYWLKLEEKRFGFCSKECRDTFRENAELVMNYRRMNGRRILL